MAEHWSHYSALVTHRHCPRQYTYKYLRNLERVAAEDVAVERDFGTWWHAMRAADSIERGLAAGSLKLVPEKVSLPEERFLPGQGLTQRAVLDAVVVWWGSLDSEVKEAWVATLGEEPADRLVYLEARYREMWAKDREYERPLGVELRWKRDLPSVRQPGSDDLISPDTAVSGYVDEVYFDERRGMVIARDHKTSKELGAQSALDDMLDSQLALYLWGATPLVSEWGLGPIRAMAYDRVRTVKPQSPVITASGALSKSVTKYDLTTYLAWATGPDGLGVPWGEPDSYFASGPRKGQPKFGVYQAEQSVIEHLSTPAWKSQWFQRSITPLNRNVIAAHLRAAVDSAFDQKLTIARFEATGDTARNLTNGCRWCPYVSLCRAEMIGGVDGEYDLADYGLQVRGTRKVRGAKNLSIVVVDSD